MSSPYFQFGTCMCDPTNCVTEHFQWKVCLYVFSWICWSMLNTLRENPVFAGHTFHAGHENCVTSNCVFLCRCCIVLQMLIFFFLKMCYDEINFHSSQLYWRGCKIRIWQNSKQIKANWTWKFLLDLRNSCLSIPTEHPLTSFFLELTTGTKPKLSAWLVSEYVYT